MSSFRLALRVLMADRRTRTSAILTAVGVAVATALVLLLVALPYATEARAERALWQDPYQNYESPAATGTALAYLNSTDYTGTSEITRVDVAALADPSSIRLPAGVPELPGPGEVLVSPALADRLDNTPAEQLGDRFGQVVGTLGDDALRFPEQLVALVGHARGTMPPDAMTLAGFPSGEAMVDPVLSLLAGVGVVVLLVPSLVLVASAARLTAARRERRLAALRLAGASPAQVTSMVAAEIAFAAVGGALLALAASPVIRSLATLVPWGGGTWQASDFVPPTWLTVGIVLAVPLLVLVAAVLGLRRVMTTPLGAAGAHQRKPLHWWRLLALPAAGLFFFVAITTAEGTGGPLVVLLGLGLVIASAAIVGPWVTSAIGGVFVRAWRRPSALLAGRRLRDDPKGAYRASAGVVLAVFIGSMALTLLPSFEAQAGGGRTFQDSVLYLDTSGDRADQVVAKANAELARYGQAERAVAAARVELENAEGSSQYALVLDCASADRLLRLEFDGACAGAPAVYSDYPFEADGVTVRSAAQPNAAGVPLPAGTPVRPVRAADQDAAGSVVVDPAVLPAGVPRDEVTVAVPTTPENREVVRTALVGAAEGTQVSSRELRLAGQQTELADLRRVTVIGLVAASVLAGCSAAIATAGSVMDRRRTFGALLAAGTPVRVLARALRTEAAMPAMVATVGAGVVGVLVGLGLFSLFDRGPIVLSPWLLAPVVLGAGVATLAASVCRPALNRVRSEPLADE